MVVQLMREDKEQWRDILYLMSDNDAVVYKELIKMEIAEFWAFYTRYKNRKEQDLQNNKKR